MAVDTGWGEIAWLVGSAEMPGSEQTLGAVTIRPGRRNPLHLHPNCEELLYVISGECDHRVADEVVHLGPGMVIRIPRGVPHYAECTGPDPLVAIVSFSSPDRRVENLEGGELA